MADDILCTCQACGKAFAGKAGKSNKFCQVTCYRSAQRAGEYRRGHGPDFPRAPCYCCGAVTARYPSRRRNGEQSDRVFCSRACYDKSRADNRGFCRHCGKKVPVKSAKFCCMTCKVAAKRPAPCTCKNCGVKFTAITWRGDQMIAFSSAKVCSPACGNEWIRRNPERKRKISEAFRLDRHPAWQGGSHRQGFRGHEWETISEMARNRAGRCCEHCHMSEAEHQEKFKMRLNVNHKEPFHQHANKSLANRLSNLEALCKSCHTRADWKWRKEHPMQAVLNFRAA